MIEILTKKSKCGAFRLKEKTINGIRLGMTFSVRNKPAKDSLREELIRV